MRFSNSFLDEIRDRVPISSVIGARVSWDRKKTNAPRGDYWACCPFHGEKIADLPLRGQEGPLPLLRLRRVGRPFPLPDRTRRHELSRSRRAHRRHGRRADAGARRRGGDSAKSSAPACTTSWRWRRRSSRSSCSRRTAPRRAPICATAACRRRRSRSFRLGYAPDSRNALKEFLAGQGRRQGADRGLRAGRPSATTFRSPTTASATASCSRSPIRGAASSPSAAARCRPDALAKYLNSPETELFHKGNVLYNFARARKAHAARTAR